MCVRQGELGVCDKKCSLISKRFEVLPLVTYQAEEEEDEADDVCAGTSLRLKGCRHLEIDTSTLQKVLFDGFSLLFISLLYCVGFHHLTRSSLSLTGSQYKQNLHTSPTPSWVATGAYQ